MIEIIKQKTITKELHGYHCKNVNRDLDLEKAYEIYFSVLIVDITLPLFTITKKFTNI